MSKHDIPLKYACMDNFSEVIQNCNDNNLADYLIQLRDLIVYQMEIIREQRMEVVGLKHKESWKHYDKPFENYDPKTRKYIDRPEKSGNASC